MEHAIVLLSSDVSFLETAGYFLPQQGLITLPAKFPEHAVHLLHTTRAKVLLYDLELLPNGHVAMDWPEIIRGEFGIDLMIILLYRAYLFPEEVERLTRISSHLYPLHLWPNEFSKFIFDLVDHEPQK